MDRITRRIAFFLGAAIFASPWAVGAQEGAFASDGRGGLPSSGFERRVILAREPGRAGAYAIPKMVVTRAGTALIVLQDRRGGDWGKPITPMVMRSSDRGQTWSRPARIGAPLDEEGRYHVKPTGIVEDARAGRVFVFLSRSPIRNKAGQTVNERWFYTHLQRTWDCGRAWFLLSSDDEGVSWSAPVEITDQLRQRPHWQHEDLRDVKCHAGLTAARDPQGRYVLLFSNVPGPGGRRGLTIRASADDGRTWGKAKVVEPGNAAYSDLAVTKDGTILCVYESGQGSRNDISLARLTWDWLYRH